MEEIMLKKVVKNFFYITFGNVISQVCTFLTYIYVARRFGKSIYGMINLANAIILYFSSMSWLGLQSLGIVIVNRNKKDGSDVCSSVNKIVSLRILLSLASYAVLVFFTLLMKGSMQFKIIVLIDGLTILGASFLIDWFFNAVQEMKYTSISIMVKNFAFSLFVLFVLLSNVWNNIYAVPVGLTLGAFLCSLYLFIEYKRKYHHKLEFVFNLKEYRWLIKNSFPFCFSGMFALINSNVDTLMLGIMKTSGEVGLYNSVYTIVNALILCIGFIYTPIYPTLIENFQKKNFTGLGTSISKLKKIIYIIAVPVFFSAFILNKEVMNTVYGKEYSGAYKVFTILIVYVSILFVREIYGYQLNAYNLQKKYMKVVMISSIYNIISNIIIIPHFGIEGAAFNTLVSEIINIVLMRRYVNSAVKLQLHSVKIYKIIINAFVMSILILLLKKVTLNAIVLAAFGTFIYGIFTLFTKTMTLREIKSIVIK